MKRQHATQELQFFYCSGMNLSSDCILFSLFTIKKRTVKVGVHISEVYWCHWYDTQAHVHRLVHKTRRAGTENGRRQGYLAGAWAHSHPAAYSLLIKQESAGGGSQWEVVRGLQSRIRQLVKLPPEFWESWWFFSASFPFLIFSETSSFLHTFLKLAIIEHSTMNISLFWISHRAF